MAYNVGINMPTNTVRVKNADGTYSNVAVDTGSGGQVVTQADLGAKAAGVLAPYYTGIGSGGAQGISGNPAVDSYNQALANYKNSGAAGFASPNQGGAIGAEQTRIATAGGGAGAPGAAGGAYSSLLKTSGPAVPLDDIVSLYLKSMQPQKERTMNAASEDTISALGARAPGGIYDKMRAYAGSLADEKISQGLVDILRQKSQEQIERERMDLLRQQSSDALHSAAAGNTWGSLAAQSARGSELSKALLGSAGGGTFGVGFGGLPTSGGGQGPVSLDLNAKDSQGGYAMSNDLLKKLLSNGLMRQQYKDPNTGGPLSIATIQAALNARNQVPMSMDYARYAQAPDDPLADAGLNSYADLIFG